MNATELIEQERAYFTAQLGPQVHGTTGDVLPGHQMTVLLDQVPYRHLRFARPYTGMWSFSLVTWPGHLAITGDLDDYVFARSLDMVEFFRSSGYHGGINPDYWAEKVVASSVHNPIREFSADRFKQHVREIGTEMVADAGLADIGVSLNRFWAEVEEELFSDDGELDDREAHQRVERFVFRYMDGLAERELRFHDTWEWDFSEFTSGYLRSCWAIRFGIDMYLNQPHATLREIAT